jgi:hypothetical protein
VPARLPVPLVTLLLGALAPGGPAVAQAAHTIAVGQTVAGRLTKSDRYQERDSTYLQAWSIAGTVGQTVTVDLESAEFDAYLFIAGPGIAEPLQDDDSGGHCNARITLTFARTAEYLIVVTSSNHGATGQFSLRVTSGAKPKSLARCAGDP